MEAPHLSSSAARPPAPAQSSLAGRLGLLLLLLFGLAGAAPAGSVPTRIEVKLRGMDCSLCSQGLETRLRQLPGAEAVRLDLERGRLDLTVRAGSAVADDTLRALMRNAGIVVLGIRREPVALP